MSDKSTTGLTKQDIKDEIYRKLTIIDFLDVSEAKQEELITLLSNWEEGINNVDKDYINEQLINCVMEREKTNKYLSIREKVLATILMIIVTAWLFIVCQSACFFAIRYYDNEVTGDVLYQGVPQQSISDNTQNKTSI